MTILPTGILTFVFTDIEGSTRLWEQFPEQMQHALVRHNELIATAVEAHGGVFVRTRGEGDSTFSVFTSPTEAVAAACDFQKAMTGETWPPETVLRVRTALHTGTSFLSQADYNSSDVNRCARLRAIAHGGQTLLSEATYQLAQLALPEGVTLQDMGLHWLKDLREPEHVFQLQHPDLQTGFPPLNSLNALPNNLPRQVSSFIGRQEEIQTLQDLLKTTPLLTLVGMGGTGKTRLALQVAAEVLETYPAGVWLVELAALSDPAFVPQTVATALGLREQFGQTLTQTLIDYLQSRKLLLVLDNCEHLIEACASLAEAVLRSCPKVSILATSREPLNLPGEHAWRVPTLRLPTEMPSEESDQVAAALGSDACRLFVERVRLLRPEFELSRSTAPVAVRLCRRLEGIPLALELAAARVRVLSVEQIESRLDDRFRLLAGGSRGVLPRQQTLRALIDWSYDLLSGTERVLLKRLSVFAGGWTLEAAEAISDFRFPISEFETASSPTEASTPTRTQEGVSIENRKSKIENWEVLDLLTSLVDKSLVLPEEKEGAVRYRMLETVRQYAVEKLAESGEEALMRGRFGEWYLSLCEEAEPKLMGPEQGAWLARLETEHDNLRTALAWSLKAKDELGRMKDELGQIHPSSFIPHPFSGEAALRLCSALRQFWYTHGHWKEGRAWCAAALAAEGAQERTAVRAKTLNGVGLLCYSQGDYASAQANYEESLAIRREIGDRKGIANSLANLGSLLFDQGDNASARANFEQSLSIQWEIGDQPGIASALNNLGIIAENQGDITSAQAYYKESLSIWREIGAQSYLSRPLTNLGKLSFSQGDFTSARTYFEQSLSTQQECGDRKGIAISLNNLGNVSNEQGDRASAQALYQQSLSIRREIGDRQGIANALTNLGNLARLQGDHDSAQAYYKQSLSIQREIGDRQGIAYSLEGLARLASILTQTAIAPADHAGISEHRNVGTDLRRTAWLWGAAQALREQIGAPLSTREQAILAREVEAAQERLGKAEWEAAWEEGRTMPLEEAMSAVLEQNHER